MSFFEDLGDAFESNAGWFMLANMVNTNRIASAQTSIAQAQRDADRNSHRLKLRELELLEKEAKEANRDRQERRAREELDRQQRDAEAISRRKFLSSFAYSQLTFEQNDEWGFSLASLDILIPSLQSLLDVSAASSEEIQTFERFVVKVDRARSAFLLGSNAKTCFSAAILRLDRWRESLCILTELSDELAAIISQWSESVYRTSSNPSLLQFALSISETPLRYLQANSTTNSQAQAQITDRQGLIRCSEAEWNAVYHECKTVNVTLAGQASSMHESIHSRQKQFITANPWLLIQNSSQDVCRKDFLEVDSGDILRTLATGPRYSSIGLVDSVQTFLGIMEQVESAKKSNSTGAEYAGLLRVSSKAIPFCHQFKNQLGSTNDALNRLRWSMQLAQSLANSELANAFQEGVSRIMYINQQTIERQRKAIVDLKEQRLADFSSRKQLGGNSKFSNIRQSRRNTRINVDSSRKDPISDNASLSSLPRDQAEATSLTELSESGDDLGNSVAWVLAGNLSDIETHLDLIRQKTDSEPQQEYALRQAIKQVQERWLRIENLFSVACQAYANATSVQGKINFLKSGACPELEEALRAFHSATVESGFQVGSELRSQLEEKIAELRSACEWIGICFDWSATPIPLVDAVRFAQPVQVTPYQAYVNALCAMASADGDFSSQERWAVKKWVAEARLTIDPSELEATIDQWCTMAREQSLQRKIAQSVVGVQLLRKTTMAAKLLQGLSAVLRADGKTTASETQLFEQIGKQLA